MKKEELIQKLEVVKDHSPVVSIDKVIALIEQITPEVKVGITQELAEEIANRIERCLDRNCDELVDKDDITFSIAYGNTIEVEDASINVSETMNHITACLEEFVVEEDEDEELTEEAAI